MAKRGRQWILGTLFSYKKRWGLAFSLQNKRANALAGGQFADLFLALRRGAFGSFSVSEFLRFAFAFVAIQEENCASVAII